MTNSLKVHASLPLVEEILSPWQERIGTDYDGYKNHVYRMLHCCFALAPPLRSPLTAPGEPNLAVSIEIA